MKLLGLDLFCSWMGIIFIVQSIRLALPVHSFSSLAGDCLFARTQRFLNGSHFPIYTITEFAHIFGKK